MLRASRRVLKPAGILSFLAIVMADDQRDDVERGGDYPLLMAEAGFDDVELVDVTEPYRDTLEAWIREREAEREELESLMGVDEFAERQTARREDLAGIDSGLVRRFMISATRA